MKILETLDDPHIDLARARHLAAACGRAAPSLLADAALLRGAAVLAGLDTLPALRLMEVAEWAQDQERRINALLTAVRSWPDGVPSRWRVTDRGHPAYGRPTAAVDAALTAGRALEAADPLNRVELPALLDRWGDNPVFAAVLLTRMGASRLVDHLVAVDAQGGAGGNRGRVARQTATGLGAVLATASRHGVGRIDPRGLATVARRQGPGLRVLGALFVGPHRFHSGFLAAAVPAIALPLMATAATGGRADVAALAGVAGGADVPALILDRAASNPTAARRVLAGVDLDALLDMGHGDGGFAAARLVAAGTAPPGVAGVLTSTVPLGRSGSSMARAGANLARISSWMGERTGPLPLGVEMSMDRILGPWIGSVRGPGLDAHSVRHAPLDEAGARRLLGRGLRFDGVRQRLVGQAWRWASTEAVHLAGRGRPGPGFDAVGSVLGIVTISAHDAAAASAAHADERRAAHRALWSTAQKAASRFAPPLVRTGLSAVSGPAGDRLLPDTDLEFEHWRDHRDGQVAAEAEVLEQVVVQALWAHDRDAVPSFLADGGRLRPIWDLGPDEVVRYQRWRSATAARGPAPVQLAVERFLAEGREAGPTAPPPAG